METGENKDIYWDKEISPRTKCTLSTLSCVDISIKLLLDEYNGEHKQELEI